MIRLATPQDMDQMLATDHVAAGGDRDRIERLNRAARAGECLVHVDDRRVVDALVITRSASFFGRDFVELLVVAGDRRRSGIGRRILRAAVERSGTATAFTSTNESNRPMRMLLESAGWNFSGRLTGLDDDDPELVFWTVT